MIAMQYGFTLPRDYDMGIIERRISEKGPMLDDFDGLAFKAYLFARIGDETGGRENIYAPFYLWREDAAMSRFLCGAGFGNLVRDLGWPAIRTWLPWHVRIAERIGQARYATRELVPIQPHADLDALRQAAVAAPEEGALATVVAFEPTGWTQLRFRLWADRPDVAGAWIARVGHISRPGQDAAPKF